jgi:hypothetical protein
MDPWISLLRVLPLRDTNITPLPLAALANCPRKTVTLRNSVSQSVSQPSVALAWIDCPIRSSVYSLGWASKQTALTTYLDIALYSTAEAF